MASITQDMKYRLSLIQYAEKFGVTKAAVKYKDSISTDGNAARTVPGTPCGTAPVDPITTPTSIRLMRSA